MFLCTYKKMFLTDGASKSNYKKIDFLFENKKFSSQFVIFLGTDNFLN